MGSEAHLKSIAAVPQMIENAIYITELPNEKGNGKYDSYRYYVTGMRIGGEDYTAKIVIGVDENGNKYYDHSLTEIEKGKLIDEVGALSTTLPSDNESPYLSVGKDTDLIGNEQGSGKKGSFDGKIDDVGESKSFATEEEAFTEIDRIIKTGKKDFEHGDKNIPPEQEALLRGHNYREYPTIQELSATKIGNNSDIAKENGENVVEDTAVAFCLEQKQRAGATCSSSRRMPTELIILQRCMAIGKVT